MKNLGLFLFMLLAMAFTSAAYAQNGQSIFSEVKVYDNLDGSGTLEAKLTPHGQGIIIGSMTLSGDRIRGVISFNGGTRVNPFILESTAGPGNSGGTTLVVNFVMEPESTNGGNSVQGQVYYTRRVGDHIVQDSFAFEREVRRR